MDVVQSPSLKHDNNFWANQHLENRGVEMAGFNRFIKTSFVKTRKNNAHRRVQPIEKADATDKRDLFENGIGNQDRLSHPFGKRMLTAAVEAPR
jgi:hypothetical protein